MKNETDSLGESGPTRLWVTTTKDLPRRSRAGLRFERGTYREVEILALSKAQIDDVQKTGASVVNAAGAQEILDDDALDVRETPPPLPRKTALAEAPVIVATMIAWWVTLAKALGLARPTRRAPALIALRAAVEHRARTAGVHCLAAIWRRVAQLLESEVVGGDEVNTLMFAIGADAIGADVPPLYALPPVTPQRWASNETPLPWMKVIADQIGETFPPRLSEAPAVSARPSHAGCVNKASR